MKIDKLRLLSLLFATFFCAGFAQTHAIAAQAVKPSRLIVSLSPAATEWVYALGLGAQLVGVTEQCDFPLEARSLPKVGSYMSTSVERILSLNATDVVSTQTLPTLLMKKLDRARVRVHVFEPRRLTEFPIEIQSLGKSFDLQARGAELAREFASALKIDRHAKEKANLTRKSALIFVSAQPVFVAAPQTWLSDLFELAGYSNSFPAALSTVAFPRVSIESLARIQTDYWFVFSDRPRDEPEFLMSYERLKKKLGEGVVKTRTVALPSDLFQRPGPRLREAYQLLQKELK
jgi:iron complex transport system substrate-binding protein